MTVELETGQNQIQRILQSKAFRTSEVHRNLLNYLAEKSLTGVADSLKEYTVGLDVFAKPASYDPRQESVVRMHMARLRQKLAEYYRTDGAQDEIIVDVPKGGFRVTFEPRTAVAEISPAALPPFVPAPHTHRTEIALGVLLVLAVILAGYLGVQLWRAGRPLAQAANNWSPEIQQLWHPLLSSSRPLVVCLATQPATPPGAAAGAPGGDFAQGTTGVGTASGAFLLGQFLAQRKSHVVLVRSDQLSAPEMAMGDVVFLGPMHGARGVEASSAERPIVLEADGIRNLHPRPGEPSFVTDRLPKDSQDTEDSYALISYLPGLAGSGEILYLSGNQVSSVTAGVQAFTDPLVARPIVAKLRRPDGDLPRYYQIVLKVKSMDGMPLEISYLFHREIIPSKTSTP